MPSAYLQMHTFPAGMALTKVLVCTVFIGGKERQLVLIPPFHRRWDSWDTVQPGVDN